MTLTIQKSRWNGGLRGPGIAVPGGRFGEIHERQTGKRPSCGNETGTAIPAAEVVKKALTRGMCRTDNGFLKKELEP